MNSFQKLIEELKQYEPQRIAIADIPKTLRLGWKIYNPERHFTIRLEEAKATWPKALFELVFAEKGREALRDLLYEKAWGIK